MTAVNVPFPKIPSIVPVRYPLLIRICWSFLTSSMSLPFERYRQYLRSLGEGVVVITGVVIVGVVVVVVVTLFKNALVPGPTIPSAVRLLIDWNFLTAVSVFGPKEPSAIPVRYPFSIRIF